MDRRKIVSGRPMTTAKCPKVIAGEILISFKKKMHDVLRKC